LVKFSVKKCQRPQVTVTNVLALATLGDTAQIDTILIAKASKEGNIALCQCMRALRHPAHRCPCKEDPSRDISSQKVQFNKSKHKTRQPGRQ